MKKVYIVTDGDYSDYRIIAAFTREDKAEEYRRNFEYYSVEEYELDPSTTPIDITTVWMSSDGTVESTWPRVEPVDTSGFVRYANERSNKAVLIYRVNTKDEKRAIKVVNEKRTQILAYDVWGNEELTKLYMNKEENGTTDTGL